jgi:hypothetical protein
MKQVMMAVQVAVIVVGMQLPARWAQALQIWANGIGHQRPLVPFLSPQV